MGVEAVVGSAFTFQARFLDGTNTPVAVATPLIEIFNFTASGVKTVLQASVAMAAVTPAETGRYTYVYTIPTTLVDGGTIYAEMSGVDGANTIRVSQEVTVISANRGLGAAASMSASFTGPGI